MIFLLVAGILLGVAGLLTTGFGIPVKDTTSGSAILLSGIVLLCSALILIGLGLLVRELRAVQRAIARGSVRVGQHGPAPRAAAPGASHGPPPFAAAGEPPRGAAQGSVAQALPPWLAQAAARERVHSTDAPASTPSGPPSPPQAAAEEDPPQKPPAEPERPARRNFLFATRRRDRSVAEQDGADQLKDVELPAMIAPVLPPMTGLGAEPRSPSETVQLATRNGGFGRQGKPAASAIAIPPESEQAAGTESTGQSVPGLKQPAGRGSEVTVVRSGTVDGMAYSLYSDGSIEAHMPEGVLHFASVDALRAHLDERSH
jgi:hypothetical protein